MPLFPGSQIKCKETITRTDKECFVAALRWSQYVYWQRLTANTNSFSTSDQGNILHRKSIDKDSSQQIKNDGDKLKRDAQFTENIPVMKNVERLPGKCTIFKDMCYHSG